MTKKKQSEESFSFMKNGIMDVTNMNTSERWENDITSITEYT